jgi:hypothetical protein
MSEEVSVEKTVYYSFLLRLWSIRQNGQISWRASLENPHTKQQQFFYCLEDLILFLQQLNIDMESRKDDTPIEF